MPCGRMIGSGLAGLLVNGYSRKVKVPAPGNNQSDQGAHCPSCGWHITGDFSWCPKCGSRLHPYKCEYCQSLVPQQFNECPHCGAQLS